MRSTFVWPMMKVAAFPRSTWTVSWLGRRRGRATVYREPSSFRVAAPHTFNPLIFNRLRKGVREMKCLIANANIVQPDKNTILKNSSIVIENGLITDIVRGVKYRYDFSVDEMIDAEGGYVIPGLINHHSHGGSLGAFGQGGTTPMTLDLVIRNLNKHLLHGTTTVLNLDGFSVVEEVEMVNKLHPIKVRSGTSHSPLNIKAAELCDGTGLSTANRAVTIEEMLQRGAAVVGEVGGGSTMGGATVNYYYIPRAFEKKTGKPITVSVAARLNRAILGCHCDLEHVNKAEVANVLREARLAETVDVETTIALVKDAVYRSVEVGRSGMVEAAEIAAKYETPIVLHTAAASKKVVLDMARKYGSRIIAGHSNHPSFDADELIENCRELKKHGAIVDICTGDFFGAQELFTPGTLDTTLKVLSEGLADLLSTDFMGGYWDPILTFIEHAVEKKVVSLPEAVAMVTCNVTSAIPKLAPNCGLIEVGRTADLAILDASKISRVKQVLINGVVVVREGRIVNALQRGQ